MKQAIVFLLSFLLIHNSYAQEDRIEKIWEYLQAGENEKAEHYIKNELKKDKKDVDMIMMQGNVILNREMTEMNIVHLAVNSEESIYDASIAHKGGPPPMIVPEKVVKKVTKLWFKALELANERSDIHIGICQLYSMALMEDELVAYFPTLIERMKGEPDFHYSLTNYARNIIDRKQFKMGMDVYKAIVALYPLEVGLLSDIAGEYFNVGNTDSAMVYIDKVFRSDDVDALSYGNVYYMRAIVGDFEGALAGAVKEDSLSGGVDHLLYQALLSKFQNKPWKESAIAFRVNEKDVDKQRIAKLLTGDDFQWTLENYYLLLDLTNNDGQKVLLHNIFNQLYPEAYIPKYNLAEIQTFYRLHNEASTLFNAIESSDVEIGSAYIEIFHFYKAWANYKNNDLVSSKASWSKVINSNNFYFRSAACYFLGKFAHAENDIEKAKSYYGEVSKRASESKYATFCMHRLSQLENTK